MENFNFDIIPDEANRLNIIKYLNDKYTFLDCGVLSKSLCSRTIDYIHIGSRKDMVLLTGAFHGMEWLTSLLLLKFAAKICDSIQNKTKLSEISISDFLRERGVLIIPCVNPDGVEISLYGAEKAHKYKNLVNAVSNNDTSHWQANARGVDINHNFDADWCDLHKLERESLIIGPSPTRYGGIKPESEPETRALVTICRELDIRHALAFHSQGEEIYWSYGDFIPYRSELMARVMAASSGYAIGNPEGLAIGGGFKDWFISELKKPAFTIEIGKGNNPLPLKDFPYIYDKLEELLTLSLIM